MPISWGIKHLLLERKEQLEKEYLELDRQRVEIMFRMEHIKDDLDFIEERLKEKDD